MITTYDHSKYMTCTYASKVQQHGLLIQGSFFNNQFSLVRILFQRNAECKVPICFTSACTLIAYVNVVYVNVQRHVEMGIRRGYSTKGRLKQAMTWLQRTGESRTFSQMPLM